MNPGNVLANLSQNHSRHNRVKGLLTLAFLNLLFLSIGLSAQSPGTSGPIPKSYFGMTVQRDRITPVVEFATARSWDTYPLSDWADSNPSQGVYNFAALDTWIALNQSQGRDMIYTLGRTPQWASSLPNYVSILPAGECAPPTNIQDWDNYLQAIVTHAAGKIKYWEIWNEPQFPLYYCGTIPAMVTLAQHAQRIIKSIDPSAMILSPAPSSMAGPQWLSSFLSQGGASTVDIIAFHGYRTQKAEDLLQLIANYKTILATNGLSQLPMWDTEADAAAVMNSDDQSAFLAKYFLLQWSQGISRFLWYAYDSDPQWGQLMDPATGQVFPSAGAYTQVQNWMVGATLLYPCSADQYGTWTCTFSRGSYQAEAIWNSGTTTSVSLPTQFVQYLDLSGNVYPITDNVVSVGNGPILVETSATASATLGFAPVPPQTNGNPGFTVFASSASKAPVTYSVVSGPATVSGSIVTPTGAGTIVVGASQAASLGFAAATATTSINVAPGSTTLAFAPIAPQVYGASPLNLSATSASNGPVTYSVVGGPATLSGSTLTTTGSGTVLLRASQAATVNYTASTAATQFAVGIGQTTLTFAPIADWAYGTTGTSFPITATTPSGGTISYAVVSGPATLAFRTVTPTGLGTVVVSATMPATRMFNAIAITATFNVVPAPVPTLVFTPIPSKVPGINVSVSAASASSGHITYSVVSGPATISGQTVSLTGTGTVILKALQVASSQYAATTATTSFNVATNAPKLSMAPIAPQIYGGGPMTLSATSASNGPVTYTVLSGPATVSGSRITITGPGTVSLSASQAASGQYAATTTSAQFTVAKGHTSLTFAPIADWTYGTTATSFPISATSPSGGSVTYAVVSGPATVAFHTVTPTGTGTVVVSATLPATRMYNAVTTTATFKALPAAVPALVFTPIPPKTPGTTFTVYAASASSGYVTYAVVSGPATISGRTLSLTGTGTVIIEASQAASSKYAAITTTTSFKVASTSAKLILAPDVFRPLESVEEHPEPSIASGSHQPQSAAFPTLWSTDFATVPIA